MRIIAALVLVPEIALAQTPSKPPPDLRPMGYDVPAPVEGNQTFGSSCSYPQKLIGTQQYSETDLLSYRITADRSITDVTLIRPSSIPELNEAAINCVSGWHVDQSISVKFDAFTVDPSKLKIGPHKVDILWSKGCGSGEPRVWCGMPAPILTHPKAVGSHNCDAWYPPGGSTGVAKTLVFFRISVDGQVKAPRVERTSGNADLDNAAMACVSTWVFEPATEDDTPYETAFGASIQW